MTHSGTILLALSVLATPCSLAATPFDDDVPAEVVNQVIGGIFGGQTRLYSDLPEGFPVFALPDGLTILVGVDQGGRQRAILKSRFDYQAATALAYRALMDAGWQLVPRPGTQMARPGFVDPQQPSPQTQLCHPLHGSMEVSTQAGAGSTYVNLVRNVPQPGMPAPDCAVMTEMVTAQQQIPPQVQMQMRLQTQLQELMPRLVLPGPNDMTAAMGRYGGMSGSPNELETRAVLNGDWSLSQVFRHFADQITEQDWKRDDRVIGDVMASGSWTKTVDDSELVGNLTVLVTGEDTYDLRFHLIRQGAPPMTGPVMNVPSTGIRGIPAGR